MAFPTGWARKCKLTIQNGKVPGGLTDFPALITETQLPQGDNEIFDADGSHPAINGGGDIRFSSDSAGTTQLPCEIVSFVTDNTPANGTCEIWVKVPSVSSSVDTDIYIWWEKAAETQPAVTDTYGRNAVWSGEEAVYHCNEASGNLTDSTGNGHTGTADGTPLYSQTGQIGDGVGANSGGDEFNIADDAALEFGSSLSVRCWAEVADWDPLGNSNPRILSKSTGASGFSLIRLDSDSKVYFTINSETAGAGVAQPSTGTPHYFAGRYDGTDASLRIDGGADTTSTRAGGITGNSNPITLMNKPASTDARNHLGGTLDEARFGNSFLADDWLTAEYNNQGDPATFIIEGTPEATTPAAGNPKGPLGHPLHGCLGGPIG